MSALLLAGGAPLAMAETEAEFVVATPAEAERGVAVAFQFRLPRRVAAVDGRVFIDANAADAVGVAPVAGGYAFMPEMIPGGFAFGAYGLKSSGGNTVMRVILVPQTEGRLEFNVVIDAAADMDGRRLNLKATKGRGALNVAGGARLLSAAPAKPRLLPERAAGRTRDPVADGAINEKDLDVVRAGWELARARQLPCGDAVDAGADANGDGCVDVVDVQAVFADQGEPADATASGTPLTSTLGQRLVAAIDGGLASPIVAYDASTGPTFVVDSTLDTPDASPGDGTCADVAGRCTFRAALTESNWWRGANRIKFNLSGTAPIAISIGTTGLPIIQDRSGGLTIDGYSQPGSRPNTAAFGSNAVLGVMLVGPGTHTSARNPLRVTSPSNVIRGLGFRNFNRSLMLDGADAWSNRVIGSWFGFNSTGTPSSSSGQDNIVINAGARQNVIGGPNLADRNVSGRAAKAIYLYGPGTDGNVIQNNLLCATPTGTNVTSAGCRTGIDHNHGPKDGLVGGTGTNERNIVGRTTLNGIEYSHGWDPVGDDEATWQVNNNRCIGNWVGFRHNGAYDSTFRSGQEDPGSGDNGNGINVYDGSNYNLVQGNWIGSVYDGIQTMSSNATGNVIRNNIIGQSPLGQAAPLTRWGIVARLNTRTHTIEGNVIRNAAAGGVGLTRHDVRFIRITRNIVTNTSGPAIYLRPNPNDPTTGANDLLSPPRIRSATTTSVSGTALAGATVEVYRASRPAGQRGLPVQYLGAAVAASNGSWRLPVSVAAGTVLTALQIRSNGNTSELGTNVAVP